MREYLGFDKLITPALVRILFWVLIAIDVFAALGHIFGGYFLRGILILVVGPLVIRVYCEIIVVIFQINNTLTEIRDEQRSAAERAAAPLPAPPVT